MFDFLFDPALMEHAGGMLNTEMTKMTVAFLIAARMHRRWMQKDISELTRAINNVATTVAQGLELHSKRIDELTDRVDDLEKEK